MSADQLKRINEKLLDLVKKYEQVKKENSRLKSELMPAKEREMSFMEQVAMLEQKIMILKVGSGKMDEADKKDLDKKLHAYLKEIDRCISMLSD